MKRTAIVIATGLAFSAALSATPAQALASRTFVSGHGNDANVCSLTAPCRTFAATHNATAPGGEIDVLDPAGYGSLTINKAISIVNDGVGTASVLVPTGGLGIVISAGATDAISLRGLTIEGAGTGATGIAFTAGASLTIENSVIRHVTGNGLNVDATATSTLAITNTLVADNGSIGILVFPNGSGNVAAVFNRVEVNNNGSHGILVEGDNSFGTLKATVSESVATGNGSVGFRSFSSLGKAATTLTLVHSVAANNGTSLEVVSAAATIRVAMVTGNGNGWLSSGVLLSAGDNTIEGNTANEATPTSYTLK